MKQILSTLIAQFDNYKPNENAGRAKTQLELKVELIRDNFLAVMFTIFISVTVVLTAYSLIEAFNKLRSGSDNPVELEKAKSKFFWSVIALVGSLLVYAWIAIIFNFAGSVSNWVK